MKDLTYSEEKRNLWHNIVSKSKNGTWMNSRDFLDYHGNKFKDDSLIFDNAVFPAADMGNILYSHPGATYGGIIVTKDFDIKDADEVVSNILDYSIEKGYKNIYIKQPPRIYHTYPSGEIDFMLWKKGFEIKQRDLTTVIDLTKPLRFSDSCQRAVDKARKEGLYTAYIIDYEGFWDILKQNLDYKYGVDPTHTLQEIIMLEQQFPIYLMGVFKDETLIGGTVVFEMDDTIHCQYIAMDYDYQEYRPMNLLFNDLATQGMSDNKKYLDFGVSTENFGEEINWGLFNFKESFGGMGIIHEWYIFQWR